MATTISHHCLSDLAVADEKNAILLETHINTELHIIEQTDCTVIKLPFGNRVDFVGGSIIIHDKS